jgi:hypothetical protein
MRRILAAIVLLSLVSGCAEKAPDAPTAAPTLTGTWTGDIAVDGVSARMTWTLTQTETTVAGPVLVALPNGVVLLNGFLTGTLQGTTTLPYVIAVGPGGIPTRPACSGQLSGTMTATFAIASTLTGPMAITSSTCTPPLTGSTLTLTRQ